MPYYGELMALTAALIFSWTSIFFTTAGRRLNVTTVNLLRLPGATLCLALTHFILKGHIWPQGISLSDTAWIGLSGIIGLAIGDSALFKAFTTVGPRRSMTMMALAPVFTVVLAWIMLGERLGLWALLGIVIVISGVIIATMGKDGGTGQFSGLDPRVLRTGLFLAIVASAGQGLGSAFAKIGMNGAAEKTTLDSLGTSLIRLAFATIAFWLVVVPRQNFTRLRQTLQDRRGVLALTLAILWGPFISVWVSVIAIKNTEAGIAQVLLGTVPIFVVLPSWIVYKDRPTTLSLVGIAVAVAGGALIFLR